MIRIRLRFVCMRFVGMTLAALFGLAAFPMLAVGSEEMAAPDWTLNAFPGQIEYPNSAWPGRMNDYGVSRAAESASEPASASTPAYNWAGPMADSPDWRGVARDEMYFLGYQFAVIGILYVMPESISGWTDEQKENYSFEKWKDNVKNPVWDEDKWYVNYITHPYWGAAYYVRARERGLDRMQSFWFSALTSAVYEFGAEAMFEPASKTDLIVTPLFGWLLGEYVFMPWREQARASVGMGWREKMVLTLTDPLGVLFGATDQALGVKTSYSFGPMMGARPLDASLVQVGGQPQGRDQIRTATWGVQWQATF
ncbi:MAG: DUF3943 domain-containing protein [Sulfuricellaceae bacterium]|nr:DUF3943 domain-containing protein [Sulfuricellaceae bacterium]